MTQFIKIAQSSSIRKLANTFVIIFAIFTALGGYTLYASGQREALIQYQATYIHRKSTLLISAHQNFTSLRLLLKTTLLDDEFMAHSGQLKQQRSQAEFSELYRLVMLDLNEYMSLSTTDPHTPQHVLDYNIAQAQYIKLMVDDLFANVKNDFFIHGTPSMSVSDFNSDIDIAFRNLRINAENSRLNAEEQLTNQLQQSHRNTLMILFAALVILFGLFVKIIQTFNNVVLTSRNQAKRIVDGDFSIPENMSNSSTFFELLKTISSTFADLSTHISYVSTADISFENRPFLDPHHFSGAYQTLVDAVNGLTDDIIAFKSELAFTKLIVDSMPSATIMFSEDFEILNLSDYSLTLFGVDTYDEFKTLFFDLIQCPAPNEAPDHVKSFKSKISSAFQEGYIYFEWLHYTKAKEPIPTSVILYRTQYNGKDVVLSYISDIRELHNSREQELKIKSHMEFLFKSIPLKIEYWDKDFNLIYSNKLDAPLIFTRVTDIKLTRESYNLADKQPNGEPSLTYWNRHLNAVFNDLAAPDLHKWNFLLYKNDGSPIHFSVESYKTRFDGEDLVVTYSKDITDIIVESENVLRAEKEKELIKDASDAKSAFLAKMSHEIRTPISAVIGISQLELDNASHPHLTLESFSRIHTSGNMLLGIVNDILDLSRIDSGQMILSTTTYNLAELINNISQINKPSRDVTNIDFILNITPKLPLHLIGDPLRIKQVLTNTLSNAFKYTETGFVSLSVEYETIDDKHIHLVFFVEDTGIGMTNDELARIFDEYARFQESAAKFTQGTGLGMSITKKFLDMMDGHIFITSKQGIGTKVKISIPQQLADDQFIGIDVARTLEQLVPLDLAAHKKHATHHPYTRSRVLIVDDVNLNIFVAKGLLSKYDIDVDAADSGQLAIDKIENGATYDLILMDQMMPHLSGNQTTAKLRAMGYDKPIILFTADVVSTNTDYLSKGYDGFLSKPINLSTLRGLLQEFLE